MNKKYPKFLRKELWLSYFEENPDYNHTNFKIKDEQREKNREGFYEVGLELETPTQINIDIKPEEELIKIKLSSEFILSNPLNKDYRQLAFKVGINQNFKIFDFEKHFWNDDIEQYIVNKEFVNELFYSTINSSIGIIASIPKKRSVMKFNLHTGEKWKNCIKEDIICKTEDL